MTSKIKGRYEARLVIDLNFTTPVKPINLEEMKNSLFKTTTNDIKEMIESKIGSLGTVEVFLISDDFMYEEDV